LTKLVYPIRALLLQIGALVALVWATSARADLAPPPSAEFDIPYQLRLLADGTVLELSGSFSWALPQTFQATLAAAPKVRLVRLESPGGHILPAIQIATMIQQRGLNTYVGRLCASACTIAFLGGQQRWLAPRARLGFHQAHAPGILPEQANAYLRTAYEKLHVPPAFVARTLRTPPTDLWFPTQAELRAAHYTTGDAPADVLSIDNGWPPRLTDLTQRLVTTSDDAVVQFATALSDLLVRMQAMNPEACWAFAHEGPDVPQTALPRETVDAITATAKYLTDSANDRWEHMRGSEQGKKATADLVALIREKDLLPVTQGLRPGAEHVAFCPSLHRLLEAGLALPEPDRPGALRTVLSPGGR
jgi:hypothetical protein